MPEGFQILFEEGPCLVINKPGGVLTQAPPGIDSLERRIRNYLEVGAPEGKPPYLAVPHRLDRPVSGAMVFATRIKAARRLAKQFERREVSKSYWAFVEGNVQPDSGTWRDHVRKIPGVARAEIVVEDHEDAKLAALSYQVLWRNEVGTLLRVELETGRMHQIRIQASSRGHPVMGDHQYGASAEFGPQEEDLRLRWIALHARQLEFDHPVTRERVVVAAPLPPCWGSLHLADSIVVLGD